MKNNSYGPIFSIPPFITMSMFSDDKSITNSERPREHRMDEPGRGTNYIIDIMADAINGQGPFFVPCWPVSNTTGVLA
ncbi:MAG: hypothetical protein R6U32_06010 [Candidatus Woesearchaeota archaeon]